MSEEMEKASLPADLGLGLAPARTSNIFGAQGQSPNTSYRGRSGSFNPTLLTYSKDQSLTAPEKSLLACRERSYTDVTSSLAYIRSRRPSVISAAESTEDFFDESDLETVQCFLPTGMVLDVKVHPDDEMVQIKSVLISDATANEQLPLRGCLNPDPNVYYLSYISQVGSKEEVTDENKTFRELNPFLNILKFNLRTKDLAQYMFKRQVGQLIGMDMKKFDKMMSCEVNDFRWRMRVFANKMAQERRSRLKSSLKERIMYQYPARLAMNNAATTKSTDDQSLKVDLIWHDKRETEIDANLSAEELILQLGQEYGFDEEYCQQCCIKTIGEASILLGNQHKLSDYAFIRENLQPPLAIVELDSVEVDMANEAIYISLEKEAALKNSGQWMTRSPSAPPSPKSLPRKTSLTSLMSLSSSSAFHFSMVFSSAIDKPLKIFVETINFSTSFLGSNYNSTFVKHDLQIGLFHGGRTLCPLKILALKGSPSEEGVWQVQSEVEFDLTLANVPRMAKLCFGFFEKRKSANTPIAWVNSNVFDYTAKLRKRDTLQMWKYVGEIMPTYEMLSPLRTNMSNPSSRDSLSIVLSVHHYDYARIQFPNAHQKCVQPPPPPLSPILESGGNQHWSRISKLYGAELEAIAKHDPLHELTVQEKDLIWKVRDFCLHQFPRLLPRIIDCVHYQDAAQVSELHRLLETWPLLSPENALQLVDYAYPDEYVRRFAVQCLKQASDDTLSCYLLQLAQAIKHESYFGCELVEFLLERALHNQHIGHHLFWQLKAEMTSPTGVGLLYGLILEAYLVAAPEHLKMLELQLSFLEKCRSSHVNVQKMELAGNGKNFEKTKTRFMASTRCQFQSQHLRTFINPLNPTQKCKRLVWDKCRIMNSKMKPQMLFFENVDVCYKPDLANVAIMFKKGDDLRQDRLTLQLLAVMDRLWKEDEGLDLRLNIYNCMATGINEGLIQVVGEAETVCKIQMRHAEKLNFWQLKSYAALKKGLILAWLKGHNRSVESMKIAQDEFTKSCAGYCVATYILGIADRHNDNIMVRKNGQVFHIDFGHFLGNYKHKFGIKRERVPMVLPAEFVEVIRVNDFGNVDNFEVFRQLCEKAYLAIRRRAHLIISLLSLMISTGLPELNSDQDLNIVRTTLHLDSSSEQEAIEVFRKDFNESLRNSWKISFNWWFHIVNQMYSKG